MRKTLLVVATIVLAALILAACAGKNRASDNAEKPIPVEPDGGIGTTPDGVGGAIDPNKPIPVEPDDGIGLTDPYVRYVSSDPEQCKTMLFQCIIDTIPFNDDTGCGCRVEQPKKYIGNSTEKCALIRYMCAENYVPFSDENGCGCEFVFPEPELAALPPAHGKVKAFDCAPEQRNAEICTADYTPVCGWSDPAKIQCIRYPCAQTYSNSCEACKSENVAYYTLGECPNGDAELR